MGGSNDAAVTDAANVAAGDGATEEKVLDVPTISAMALLFLCHALSQVAVSLFVVISPLFIKDTFGWGPAQYAVIMATFIIGVAFSQILIFPRLQKAVGILRVGVIGSVINACASFATSFVHRHEQLPLWLAALGVQLLATANVSPIVNIKVASIAPASKLGLVRLYS